MQDSPDEERGRSRVRSPEGDGQGAGNDHDRKTEANRKVLQIVAKRVVKHGNPLPFDATGITWSDSAAERKCSGAKELPTSKMVAFGD